MAGRELLDGDYVAAANVRARRKAQGMSQSGLARSLGLTYQQVQKYENASNRMTVGQFIEIARVLETTPAALIAPTSGTRKKRASKKLSLKHSKMHIYDCNGFRLIDCKVGIQGEEIRVEYKDNGIVVYTGRDQGSGHYRLTCPEPEGWGTLHRFTEEKELVGYWQERGIYGMWRILVSAE